MEPFAMLDEQALSSVALKTDPYEHVIIPNAIKPEFKEKILADAPKITEAGSFLLDTLRFGPSFKALADDLLSERFRWHVEQKFKLPLGHLPAVLTVRGYTSGMRDGYVHTDTKHKVITVLLYLNPEWPYPGGRLRVLRSNNIDDCAAEIAPLFGTMLIFRRSDHSWHGHLPHEGPRLSLQLNWADSASWVRRENWRHRLSAAMKVSAPALQRLSCWIAGARRKLRGEQLEIRP